MKTLDEFKHAGGMLEGSRSHTHEEYEGAPRPYNEKLKTSIENVLPGHHGTHGTHGTGSTGMTGTGTGLGNTTGTGIGHSTGTGHHHSGMDNTRSGLDHNTTGSGMSNLGTTGRDGRPDSGYAGNDNNYGNNKPTMGQKLNPKIDADGDGKAGIMD